MSTIEQNLHDILNARYGKDVRQSIHDGIQACYEDGKAGSVDLIARQRIDEALANKEGIEIIQYKLIDNLSTDMIETAQGADVSASWQVSSTIASKLKDGTYEYWFLAVSTGWGVIATSPTWSIDGTTVTMKCAVINTSGETHSILVKMVALLVSKFAGFSDSEAVKTSSTDDSFHISDAVDAPTMESRMAVMSLNAASVEKPILILGNGLLDDPYSDTSFETILTNLLSETVYNTCQDLSLTRLSETAEALTSSKWEQIDTRLSGTSLSDLSMIILSIGWADRDDFESAILSLESSIETLLSALPAVPLYLSGPNYMAWKDGYGLLNQSSDSYENYLSQIKEIAKKYRIPYIDNYYELGINSFNRLSYLTVGEIGVYLNADGKEKVSKNIVKKIV